MPCNKADAVRSADSEVKKMAIKIKNTNKKNVQVIIPKITLYIAESKLIAKHRHFFYE